MAFESKKKQINKSLQETLKEDKKRSDYKGSLLAQSILAEVENKQDKTDRTDKSTKIADNIALAVSVHYL